MLFIAYIIEQYSHEEDMLASANVPEFDYSQISNIDVSWSTPAIISIIVVGAGVMALLVGFFGMQRENITALISVFVGAVCIVMGGFAFAGAGAYEEQQEIALRNDAFSQSLEDNYGAELISFGKSKTDATSDITERDVTLRTDGQIRECIAYVEPQDNVYSVYCQDEPLAPLETAIG